MEKHLTWQMPKAVSPYDDNLIGPKSFPLEATDQQRLKKYPRCLSRLEAEGKQNLNPGFGYTDHVGRGDCSRFL